MRELLTTEQAAEYLGYSPDTMRTSRSRGMLAGVEHPRFIRVGKRSVRYQLSELDRWLGIDKPEMETE